MFVISISIFYCNIQLFIRIFNSLPPFPLSFWSFKHQIHISVIVLFIILLFHLICRGSISLPHSFVDAFTIHFISNRQYPLFSTKYHSTFHFLLKDCRGTRSMWISFSQDLIYFHDCISCCWWIKTLKDNGWSLALIMIGKHMELQEIYLL